MVETCNSEVFRKDKWLSAILEVLLLKDRHEKQDFAFKHTPNSYLILTSAIRDLLEHTDFFFFSGVGLFNKLK